MKTNLFTLGILMGLASLGNAQTYFHDDYSSASQLDFYGPDRRQPTNLNVGSYFGHSAAQFTVTADSGQPDSFYNFQGIQRYADTAHTQGFGIPASGSMLSMDIYIPSSWNGNTSTSDKRGGDLWARFDDTTQTVGNDAYPSVGFYNEGDGNGLGVETFDTFTGDYNVFSLSTLATMGANIQLDGWNNLAMSFDGTSLKSYVNGVLLHSDSSVGWNNVATLEGGYVQGWRPTSFVNTNNSYTVTFDNLQAVPEPTSLAVLGLGGLALLRRRKKA